MSVSDSSSTTCLVLLRDTRGAISLESERTGTVSALYSPVAFKKESQDEKDMMIMAKYSLHMQSLINCSQGGRRVVDLQKHSHATSRPGD